MKSKKPWITSLAAVGIAIAIVLMNISFEISTYGKETALVISFLSDGFFTASVLYLGCGLLIFISEAGNFYGIQYLGYMVVSMFSFRKERFKNRKDYFTYCTEKMAKQKEQGKSSVKWVILFVGIGCLVLSAGFALLFYRLGN